MSTRPLEQEQGEVATDVSVKTERPPMYKVFLHNDDYTSMDFVVFILEAVFHHSEASAFQIMMHVHTRGIGVAGLYPHEVAEAKMERVHALAEENGYPLRCSIEPE